MVDWRACFKGQSQKKPYYVINGKLKLVFTVCSEGGHGQNDSRWSFNTIKAYTNGSIPQNENKWHLILWFLKTSEAHKLLKVVRIKQILARNWPIGICLHCVRRSLWIVTTLATLTGMQVGTYYWTQPPKEINVMCFCGKIMYLISFGDTTNGNGKNWRPFLGHFIDGAAMKNWLPLACGHLTSLFD